ncbi:MAG: hypothetical protein E6I67_00980 [Chloroflexi bacterium]|nr:MAG: hypothetical protein E6I67_00980 [Chloroflexota bacterium]
MSSTPQASPQGKVSMQKWTIGEVVIVVDPDSPCNGRSGRVTGLIQGGAVSVRFADWTYGMFDSRQLKRSGERPRDAGLEQST